ncbi:hypothetical protein [Dokdonella sp.]|uniref:hypothetical protein n=1 Tax=Dokdonella sp. TaxID=2291710 RepID=UPI002F3EE4C7
MIAFDDDRTARVPPHAEPRFPATPSPRLDLARLADALPKLGPVLWLERGPSAPEAAVSARAGDVVLLDHPALGVLARCTEVAIHEAVTPNGPREWLAFDDAGGQARAKLFLLPDSDFLAWDTMAARGCAPSRTAPTRWSAHRAFLRNAFARLAGAWRARLLEFDQRRLPWLRTLDAHAPLRISLLGLEFARTIARDEGAQFVSPLYAA